VFEDIWAKPVTVERVIVTKSINARLPLIISPSNLLVRCCRRTAHGKSPDFDPVHTRSGSTRWSIRYVAASHEIGVTDLIHLAEVDIVSRPRFDYGIDAQRQPRQFPRSKFALPPTRHGSVSLLADLPFAICGSDDD